MDAALREVDSDIADAGERELGRQRDILELIASASRFRSPLKRDG